MQLLVNYDLSFYSFFFGNRAKPHIFLLFSNVQWSFFCILKGILKILDRTTATQAQSNSVILLVKIMMSVRTKNWLHSYALS